MISDHACFVPALRRLGGDEDLFVELASVVLDDADPEIDRLREAVKAEDFETVATVGHRLKGMLSTFDDDSLTPEIQNLIDSARKRDRPTMLVAMRVAGPMMDSLLRHLRMVTDQARR